MEQASISNTDEPVAPQDSNKKSARPRPVTLTSPGDIISFQQEIKSISQDHFSLGTTGARIRIFTHYMGDYKVSLSYLSEHNIHHFIFYCQSEKPIQPVIRHLPMNTSSQDIALALRSCDVTS
jgi:hypothetical protein